MSTVESASAGGSRRHLDEEERGSALELEHLDAVRGERAPGATTRRGRSGPPAARRWTPGGVEGGGEAGDGRVAARVGNTSVSNWWSTKLVWLLTGSTLLGEARRTTAPAGKAARPPGVEWICDFDS